MFEENGDRKICIICSKGSLDMAYPGLILANAALMSGIDVTMFFTFYGLDIIAKKKYANLKMSPIGNPSMGIPNSVAGLPGFTNMATSMMKKQIEALDFPPVDEFLEIIADAGAELYACQMSADMMKLKEDDFFEGCAGIVGAMEFMEMSEGAQIIFI